MSKIARAMISKIIVSEIKDFFFVNIVAIATDINDKVIHLY